MSNTASIDKAAAMAATWWQKRLKKSKRLLTGEASQLQTQLVEAILDEWAALDRRNAGSFVEDYPPVLVLWWGLPGFLLSKAIAAAALDPEHFKNDQHIFMKVSPELVEVEANGIAITVWEVEKRGKNSKARAA